MTNDDEHRIATLLANGITSAAKISAILTSEKRKGASVSSVKRFLRSLRGEPAPTSNKAAHAPKQTVEKSETPEDINDRAKRLAELCQVRDGAVEAVELADANFEIYCARYRNVAQALEQGASRVEALADHLLGVSALARAEDITEIAIRMAEDPELGREDGESEESYEAFKRAASEANHLRAMKLLQDAFQLLSDRKIAKLNVHPDRI